MTTDALPDLEALPTQPPPPPPPPDETPSPRRQRRAKAPKAKLWRLVALILLSYGLVVSSAVLVSSGRPSATVAWAATGAYLVVTLVVFNLVLGLLGRRR